MRRAIPLLAILYPFALVLALGRVEPKWIALAAATVVGVRLLAGIGTTSSMWIAAVSVAFVLALAFTWMRNDERALMMVPAVVNLGLLSAFASTLFGGATFVERIARKRTPDLPDDEAEYCRTVTKVWCAFFVANGSCCAALALAGDRWLWAVYTGIVGYVLMGMLFAGEFLVRSKRFGRYRGSPLESVLRLAFGPPRA